MNKKYFKTKKVILWKTLDLLSLLIPFLAFLRNFIAVVTVDKISVSFPLILLCIFSSIICSVPCIFIFRAITRTIKKRQIEKATFVSNQNFEYYREKISKLRPTDISLLTDLQIETNKDIVALLLEYQLHGLITINNNSIQINSYDPSKLSYSDNIILEKFRTCNIISKSLLNNIKEWKSQCILEAKEKGLIADKTFFKTKSSNKENVKGCLVGCLFPLLLFIGSAVCLFLMYDESKFEVFLNDSMETNAQFIQELLNNPSLRNNMIICSSFVAVMGFCMYWVKACFISGVISIFSNPKLVRTNYGDEMAEYVYGLKNFIHDFSNLSEKDKDSLLLWEDYLIYSVLLEENTKVINQLLSQRNVSTGIIEILNNNEK